MTYDIKAIQKRINSLSKPKNDKSSTDQPKLQYWKPDFGDNVVRFLPYNDGNGQPFQEVGFYNSSKLNSYRLVAPYQFGKPDPINDLMTELRKEHQESHVWQMMKELRVRGSFYAPILVRGQEDKGVQIWEMSQRVVQTVYEVLVNEDYADDDLFDIQDGFDFTVTAKDSGREFKGYPVKEITVFPKRKSSPALKSKKACDDLLKSIPDLKEFFESKCMGEEKLRTMLDNFLNPDQEKEEGTVITANTDNVSDEAKSKIDSAFDDI